MRSCCFCSISINIFVNLLCCMICSASNHLYIGCYTHFSEKSVYLKSNSISQCLIKCRGLLFALKDGSSCYCGHITNTRVPSSNCNLTCADNNGTCGGNNLFAVYTVIPPYERCLDPKSIRGLGDEYNIGSTSLEICYDRCLSLNYKFILGVWYSKRIFMNCFCDDDLEGLLRIPDSECTSCPEDGCTPEKYEPRIYSVGHLLYLNKSNNEVFHCLGGVTSMNGTCNSTGCKIGWKGAKCNQRDCVIYNGKCGDHKCEDINIGNQNISECVCKEGFQSISVYDECTDIDECQNNPCNEPSETCINTVGSFMCICSTGYNYTYQSDCRVNCSKSLYICENSSSCNNLSNYICSLEIKDLHENYDRTTVAIFGVLLALCMCALLTCAMMMGMFFYRKKLKDSESRQDKLRKTIPEKGEKSNTHNLSNQDHEEEKYEELRISDIYEN